MTGRMVLAKVTHQKDIYRREGDHEWSSDNLLILPDLTMEYLIGISDSEHGELHLHFSYSGDPAHIEIQPDADYGTFTCDNLRFPSDSNAIGNPSSRIDVTSTTYNDEHTRSEIHVYVK
jgi:hypothetical protein